MKWDTTFVLLMVTIIAIFLFLGLAAAKEEQRADKCNDLGGVYTDGHCMKSEFFLYLD